MIKARAWPAKAMYILIAAALAISLLIMVAPAQKVGAQDEIPDAEWERVSTPTTDGWVLAPGSWIIDYAISEEGEVAYAIVYQWEVQCPPPCGEEPSGNGRNGPDNYLLKSDDHAATWDDDITDALVDLLEDEGHNVTAGWDLLRVACDADDSDFVAVALNISGGIYVYISTDGGSTFLDEPGYVMDDGYYFPNREAVADLAVSPEDDGEHNIAIVGTNWATALIFRCTAEGDSVSGWEDARYDGWDDEVGGVPAFNSTYVTWVEFAPSWTADNTILVTTVVDEGGGLYSVYLQSGTWGTTEGWNEQSVVAIPAVLVEDNVDLPMQFAAYDARSLAGVTLPLDYSGRNTNGRYAWVWVNYYLGGTVPASMIYKVKNDDADPVGPMGQVEDGEVWLTNVDYLGYISEGKAIAGVGGDGEDNLADCCEGVQVYRNDGIINMDVCCEPWEESCKPPTGRAAMAVSYVSDDPATSKAYAVDLWCEFGYESYDESAWSVSFDDGDVWNQLSLVDTHIDYFSDVAVSPDCNKTMLVSVNPWRGCECDSVWLHADILPEAEEYSGKWLRTWNGNLIGNEGTDQEWGLLRLAPEETTGDTVYLVDYYSDTVYWNELETLYCWNRGAATVDNIVDLAVKDRETIFALDDGGTVAMSDDYALGWHPAVESEVDAGWTIAVWGDWILVGGRDGEVSYSDDGGETFTALKDIDISGASGSKVTVAFDTYFDTNNTIYAAVEAWGSHPSKLGGIYRWVIDESEKWTDLKAEPLESQIGIWDGDTMDETVEVAFTGLVVDRPGNPYTSAENGGVIYASYYGSHNNTLFTGVARSLERDITICTTCLVWDFLIEGLTPGGEGDCPHPEVFDAAPDALKICGCLDPDTSSKLFAIDNWEHDWDYDFCDNDFGSVWTFEDCYAKKAPEITSPADGGVIPADPCSCYSVPFTVLWDSMCDACSYDIAFALDEEFEMPVSVNEGAGITYHVIGDVPSFSVSGGELGGLSCETTYYVRVRAADAATGQIIHSFWSDPIEITIAPSVQAGEITLVSPEPGATGVAINNIAFSWDLLAETDAFDWVLSANADLSSPIATVEGLTTASGEYSGVDLDYETPYYWQVTAYKEGVPISRSSIGTFTTAAKAQFCCPQCGLCFDTQAELQEHIEELHGMVTPAWVWAVIAIGAVLVIVVIVLIFRTRRV